MNRYSSTRPDARRLGSEYQTAASYLRRGSKQAVGTGDRSALAPCDVLAADEVQQTGGDATPNSDPQHGNTEVSPRKQR